MSPITILKAPGSAQQGAKIYSMSWVGRAGVQSRAGLKLPLGEQLPSSGSAVNEVGGVVSDAFSKVGRWRGLGMVVSSTLLADLLSYGWDIFIFTPGQVVFCNVFITHVHIMMIKKIRVIGEQ